MNLNISGTRGSNTRRASAALAVGVAVAATMTACGDSSHDASADPCKSPLTIVVTNDDGYQGEGINAIYRALTTSGEKVTMVAPLEQQSGKGGAKTFEGELKVSKPVPNDPNIFAVSGSPADSASIALSGVLGNPKPDLVVSGTNAGGNMSVDVNHSGTVGAVVTAGALGVPAIAVSSVYPEETNPAPKGDPNPQFAATADYVVKLLSKVKSAANGCGQVMPKGVMLNVNYPGEGFKGTRLAELGTVSPLGLVYTPQPDGVYKVGYDLTRAQKAGQEPLADDAKIDYELIAHGYATITGLTGRLDANGSVDAQSYAKELVKKMN